MNLPKTFFFGFKKGMNYFGQNIIIIINAILLSIVYFIGVGITSVIARTFKKNFLDDKKSNKKKTYWSDLNLKKKPIEDYYRQL